MRDELVASRREVEAREQSLAQELAAGKIQARMRRARDAKAMKQVHVAHASLISAAQLQRAREILG